MPTVAAASLTATLRSALRSRKADALEKPRNGIPQLQVCLQACNGYKVRLSIHERRVGSAETLLLLAHAG